jgi:carboxymethylenebutenolidase
MCHADPVDQDAPDVAQREVLVPVAAGETVPASCYLPAEQPAPAVVILSDIYGRAPFYRALAARLALDGYVVTLPDLFFRQGPLPEVTREAAFERHSRMDETVALTDSAATVRWARSQPQVRGGRVGLLGFCLGGSLALDLCAEDDSVVTVCYYAFPRGVGNPCVRKMPRPIDLAPRITTPVLAHWGDADYIPLEDIHEFRAAMLAAGNPCQAHIYRGAGHGFLQGLVEPRADSEAAAVSWQRSRQFFAQRLRGATPGGASEVRPRGRTAVSGEGAPE